jgi:hypothetical protein
MGLDKELSEKKRKQQRNSQNIVMNSELQLWQPYNNFSFIFPFFNVFLEIIYLFYVV